MAETDDKRKNVEKIEAILRTSPTFSGEDADLHWGLCYLSINFIPVQTACRQLLSFDDDNPELLSFNNDKWEDDGRPDIPELATRIGEYIIKDKWEDDGKPDIPELVTRIAEYIVKFKADNIFLSYMMPEYGTDCCAHPPTKEHGGNWKNVAPDVYHSYGDFDDNNLTGVMYQYKPGLKWDQGKLVL